jgi:hypothetical protein
MATHAQGTFAINSWDEKTWEGEQWQHGTPPMLTHARITQTFQGDFSGSCESQALMAYSDTGALYVGMQRMSGTLGGRTGTFLMQWQGSYHDDTAWVQWEVVPGTATGELRGLTGSGGYQAGHSMTGIAYTLEYAFE